jgi:hypothetical protein
MIVKLLAVAAAAMTIAACSAEVAPTDAYTYPNFWRAPAVSSLGSTSVPTRRDLAITLGASADTSILETRADSPGI